MKRLNGPTRMVVIDSGKYDFADIDLTKPLHLIGPNNIGKTSLISMLQFLYIDKQNKMEFSSDQSTSRRYYFPRSSSYMLFEINTPSGFMVVGIHGLGAVRKFAFERFCYRGVLKVSDYITEKQTIRDASEIRKSLATRAYKNLEPHQLQEILMGTGVSGIDLGMLPLRQRKQYDQFRTLFKKLLNLAHLKQDELKNAFLQIYSSSLQQRKIDLSGNYSELHKQFKRQKSEIDDLKNIKPIIERALNSVDHRAEARAKAAALWKIIQNQYIVEKEGKEHKNNQSKTQIVLHQSEVTLLTGQRVHLHEDREVHKKQILRWDFTLGELATLEKNLSNFVPEIEDAKRQKIKAEIERVAASLIGSEKSPEALNERLNEIQKKITRFTNLLDNSEDIVANVLKGKLDEQSLESIFKVLNPEIAHLKCGESIHIESLELAFSSLKTIESQIEGSELSSQGVKIDLSSLSGPELHKLRDPILLRGKLKSAKVERDEINASMEAARNRQQIEAKKRELEAKRDAITIKLNDWAQYQDKLKQKNYWLEEKRACEKLISALTGDLDKINQAIEFETDKRDACESTAKALTTEIAALDETMRQIKTPDEAWTPTADVKGADTFDLNVAEYNEFFQNAMEFHKQVCNDRKLIESITYDRFSFENEVLWVKAMTDEIEGLNKKEEAANHMWHGIIAGMRKDFKALKHDLDMMGSHITAFNKAIKKFNVSNLTSLNIKINRRGNLTAPIEKLINEEETPLLAGRETVIDSLGELLQKQPLISLDDLFDLSFVVEADGAQEKTYKQLDAIESNGTTITIKVLIYLLLIRLLMTKDVRLPFYLDEAASLDTKNLKGIIKQATQLGFVPMLASPDGMDIAENLYFLQEEHGKIVLNDASRVTLTEFEPGI